ncbi:molybdopterin-dependent oxidoreductase [Planktotalea sp.]|uniref:molybdopterin-dependent oxidoreductase n=1 Tax=Planktotalea sp. TaxID=2029877 RepID=UPI0035C8318A
MTNLLKAILTVLSFIALPSLVSAEDILSITNGDVTVELTKADVAKLEQTAFETTTIWTEGKIEFSGPTLKSILELANITEGVVSLTAINDYTIEIPVADITEEAPIVANLMNGEPFNRREKGPYWVVYPFDADKKYQQEEVYALSIWQLSSILKNPEE